MERFRKRETSKMRKAMQLVGIMLLTSIFTVLLYQMYEGIEIGNTYGGENKKTLGEYTSIEEEQETKEEREITDVVEQVTSCVVGISKIKNAGKTIFLKDGTSKLGLGSGVIVTENGYILSNEHVTGAKFSNCYVTLEDGRTYVANVVWSDSAIDLSICKINMSNLPYATLGDSSKVKVGKTVYAIGNPIGYEFQRTVTSGIISAINRTIKVEEEIEGKTVENYMEDLIQTDATINKGNSGGPLIDANGNILGITSVKITSAEGIGFAVPINVVKPIIEKYQKEGKFEEASLGIFAYDKEVIPYLEDSISLEGGIYIAQISLDSPAAKTNLQVGDIITKIDEKPLNKMCDLRCYIYKKSPGDEVTLTVYRNKKEQQIVVKLGKK